MKKFSTLLLSLSSFTFSAYAGVDPEVHKLCKEAKDYLGCVKAMNNEPINTPDLRLIQGGIELSGNKCPNGYAYSGAGYCKEVKCKDKFTAHKDFKDKGWTCNAWLKPHWGENTVKAAIDKSCPDKEPIIGTISSCFDQSQLDRMKARKEYEKKKKKYKQCQLPANKKKPSCKNVEEPSMFYLFF